MSNLTKQHLQLEGELQRDSTQLPPLQVKVTREKFSDFYLLHLEDGQIEELEIEEVNRWFDHRGADMYAIGQALDHVWNFGEAIVTIRSPKKPPASARDRYLPDLT